jgi:hypothetical protein
MLEILAVTDYLVFIVVIKFQLSQKNTYTVEKECNSKND